MVLVLALALIQ